MGFVVKLLIAIIGSILGILMMRYNFEITRMIGHNYYAERYLGDGGTYSMWKILGGLTTVVCLFWLFA